MPSTLLFLTATLLLSLNLVRPFNLAVSDWLYFGALSFGLLETFLMQRRHAPCWWQNRFLWAVALILFGAIVSTMNSQDWATALVEVFQQAFVMTLFVSLIWIMVRRGKTTPIVLVFIFSGLLAAGIALIDYLTGSRLGPALSGTPNLQLWGRFAGTLGHPNKLGYFLVLTTLLSVGQILSIKTSRSAPLSRLVWGAFIAIQIFGIYLSGSMTAYLGLAAGFIVILFSSRIILGRTTKTLAAVTGMVIFILAFWFIVNPVLASDTENLKENAFYRALSRVQTSTAGSRMTTYAQAWEQIIRNPWFGVGYDQISTSGVSAASRFLDFSVHNPLLQIWYTGGVFALIGWLAVYAMNGWMVLKILSSKGYRVLSPQILSLAVTTAALLLMDQFQDAIYQREKWLIIGLLAGTVWEDIQTKDESHQEGSAPQ